MSKVVKYYYSSPVVKATIAINPILNKTVISKVRQSKRYTMAAVYDDEAKTIKFGLAICQEIDNFCKATGRSIAEHRAETNPFYVIKDFNGIRNDYADEVMRIMTEKEIELMKRDNPNLFNAECFIN